MSVHVAVAGAEQEEHIKFCCKLLLSISRAVFADLMPGTVYKSQRAALILWQMVLLAVREGRPRAPPSLVQVTYDTSCYNT